MTGGGAPAAASPYARQPVHTLEPTMPLLQLWERDGSEQTNPTGEEKRRTEMRLNPEQTRLAPLEV